MSSNYERYRDQKIAYQSTSKKAAEARKRYYEKNKVALVEKAKERRQLPEGKMQTAFKAARADAKRQGLPFEISFSDVWPHATHCPVLKTPMEFTEMHDPSNPCIGRADPRQGYTKSNVHVVSRRAKTIMQDATLEEIELIFSFMNCYTQ